jgi:hypothetical protein
MPGEDLIGNHPEGVKVGGAGGRALADELRCDIERRPEKSPGGGQTPSSSSLSAEPGVISRKREGFSFQA